jgi:hypothetical protein
MPGDGRVTVSLRRSIGPLMTSQWSGMKPYFRNSASAAGVRR